MKIISSNIADIDENRKIISEIISKTKLMLTDSKIVIPSYLPLEISHHYGIDQFLQYGCVTINIINRTYCKKIIILFPNQKHPSHIHHIKEETFHIQNGSMILTVNEKKYNLKAGQLFTIFSGEVHSFSSKSGCIFEEISTTHYTDDSYYIDNVIAQKNLNERKTVIAAWNT